MIGKKIIGTILTGIFVTSIFTGVAFAENRKQKMQEFKVQKTASQEKSKEKRQEIKNEKKVIFKDLKKLNKDVKKFKYDKKKLKTDIKALKARFEQMQKPVTYQQSIVLTVRAMGYDTDAQAHMGDKLETKFKVAPWAVGYVSEAVYKGLITIDEVNKQNPNKPITRTDLAVMLVKAKGETVDSSAYLTVKDAAYIPADKAPYVAKALEKGWFTVDKENAFRPNKPVTRATFAAAFIKAGFDASAFMPKYYKLNGIVSDVTTAPNAVTLKVKDAELNFAVFDGAKIRVNGKTADFTAIKAGMKFNARIADNVIVEINAGTKTEETSETEE